MSGTAGVLNNAVQSGLDTLKNTNGLQNEGERLTQLMNEADGAPDKYVFNPLASYLQSFLPQDAQNAIANTVKNNPKVVGALADYADTGNSVMAILPYL